MVSSIVFFGNHLVVVFCLLLGFVIFVKTCIVQGSVVLESAYLLQGFWVPTSGLMVGSSHWVCIVFGFFVFVSDLVWHYV